jgi:tetratricopeptide (TPR) repeat protein
MAERERVNSEVIRKGYSAEEIATIYELGRLFLENGYLRKGEIVMRGLTAVAPSYLPAWLGICYVYLTGQRFDAALLAARQALRADPRSSEAMLLLVVALLSTGDYNSAGTYLGEIKEQIDFGELNNPAFVRLYQSQIERFQLRQRENIERSQVAQIKES